jgi:hypothetical protein
MDRRCWLKTLALAPAAALPGLRCLWPEEMSAQQRAGAPPVEPFKPSEEANSPVGEGKGVHPGRVAWVRDAKALTWDGTTGHWWDDACTDQKAIDQMTTRVLLDLTGQKNEKQAWDALFRQFNQTHKGGNAGYRPGEKIAIKINANQDRSPDWSNLTPSFGRPPGGAGRGGPPPASGRAGAPPEGARPPQPPRVPQNGVPSPHAVFSLVSHLIKVAGVRGEDILLYDTTGGRNIGQPIFTRIRAVSDPQFQAVKVLVGTNFDLAGRLSATPDQANPIRFAKPEVHTAYLSDQVTAAKYMINMALLRAHGMAGVTLIGKNHFGSVYFPEDGGWLPRLLHNEVMRTQAMGSYNALVDLMGHRHLGGKTMLYMLDGLYTAAHNEGNVMRWKSFGDQWASSLLASQDPVALDSVGLDLLRNEPNATEVRGNAENYLHEAAMAAKPPSGIVYNPDGSGRLASLGVHEHWNNAQEKKYSRNLGRKQGIELIASV